MKAGYRLVIYQRYVTFFAKATVDCFSVFFLIIIILFVWWLLFNQLNFGMFVVVLFHYYFSKPRLIIPSNEVND